MASHNHRFPFMKDHPSSSSSSSLCQNPTITSKEEETPYCAFPPSNSEVELLQHAKIEHNLSNLPQSQIQMNSNDEKMLIKRVVSESLGQNLSSTMQEQENPYYAFLASNYEVGPLDHAKTEQSQIQMNSNDKNMLTKRVVSKSPCQNQNQNHTMQEQEIPNYAFLASNHEVEPLDHAEHNLSNPPQIQMNSNDKMPMKRVVSETPNYACLPSNNYKVNQYLQSYSEEEFLEHAMERFKLSNPPYNQSQMHSYLNKMPMMRVNSELNPRTITPNRFGYSSSIGNNGTLGFGQQYSLKSILSPVVDLLENYRGQLVSMAKHQDGFRLLQNMIDRGTPTELDTIFLEIKDHLYDLMMHPLGTKVIQKFLQPNGLFTRYVHHVLDFITEDAHKLKLVCTNQHGTLAIQQMLLHIRTAEHIIAITLVMRRITVPLMKDSNGGEVMELYLSLFPTNCQKVIMDEVSRHCKDVLTDKNGCSVIQRCLPLVKTEAMYKLYQQMVEHALDLAEDRYGNYALQYIIKMKIPVPSVNELITSRLRGSYVRLSMNKHASNVVEDLLRYSETEAVDIIVEEIMNSPNFLNVLQDQFGNYVAQSALECTKDLIYERLCCVILSKEEHLYSHLYGKRVLTSIKGYKLRI